MENKIFDEWDRKWRYILSKASVLSFRPDWRSIFHGCPYALEIRKKLKVMFYDERVKALRRILKQEGRQIELNEYVEGFLEYLKGDEGLNRQQTMEGRKEMLATLLSLNNIDNLTKDDVIEIVQYSWATQWFSDYPHKSMDILRKNGLCKFRKELKKLLYGTDRLHKRFDDLEMHIKGLGAQYISEILAFNFPQKCCIWNRVAADITIYLGISNRLPYDVWKYRMRLNGKNYVRCCKILETIKNELSNFGFEQPDFVDLYQFMLFLYEELKKQPVVLEEVKSFSKESK